MSTAAADYRKLAKRYQALPEQMVRAGAAELRKTTLATLKRDTGGDRILSGTTRRGRRPKPLNVKVTVEHTRQLATATFQPAGSRGYWSIIEGGTVKGSPAKYTFTGGVNAGVNAAERAMADLWERTV